MPEFLLLDIVHKVIFHCSYFLITHAILRDPDFSSAWNISQQYVLLCLKHNSTNSFARKLVHFVTTPFPFIYNPAIIAHCFTGTNANSPNQYRVHPQPACSPILFLVKNASTFASSNGVRILFFRCQSALIIRRMSQHEEPPPTNCVFLHIKILCASYWFWQKWYQALENCVHLIKSLL